MRTKKAILNFLTDVFPQILLAIIGIYKSKLFLNFLGQEQLGLYQFYGQLMAYLVLIEGGIGSAILFRLYKPLAKKNEKEVNIIMSTSRFLFRFVGWLILIVGVIIAINIGLLVKADGISLNYIQITFFVYLLSQSILYFTIPQRMLFDADQKRYVTNLIFQIMTIIKSIVEIIIVFCGGKLIVIVLSLLINSIISNLILIIVCKIYYPKVNYHSKKDFSVLKDVKHLFVNTIGNLIANNIDILIITKFIGLSSVVIYSSYNYIMESLRQIIDKLTGSVMSGVANVLVDDKTKGYDIFLEFNSLCFYIGNIICVPLLYAINPFINIWYENQIMTSLLLAISFTIILYYQIIKTPLKVYTFAAGMFEKVKKYVIMECIINLSLSLIFIKFWGIFGVLFATIISFVIADYIPKSYVVNKDILGKESKNYHLDNLKYFLILFTTIIIFSFSLKIKYSKIFIWFLISVIIFSLNFLIVTFCYYKINALKFINRFNLKRFWKGSK